MTFDEAQALLDKLKEGQTFEYGQITAALVATGDIGHIQRGMAAGLRGPLLDLAVCAAPQGTGAAGSRYLVAGNEGTDWSNTGTGCVATVD